MCADFDAVCHGDSEPERLAQHFWEPFGYPDCFPDHHRLSDSERERDSEHEWEPDRDWNAFAEQQPECDGLSINDAVAQRVRNPHRLAHGQSIKLGERQ